MMDVLMKDKGMIHFVGIGGIGMSGIAEVLSTLGYGVQGSDMTENAQVKHLRALGISVSIGHKADRVDDSVWVVVMSSAVGEDNIEIREARQRRIPVIRRAEMLAEIMRFKHSVVIGGSHGKTTTTSLVANVLARGGYDPTVVNGGVIEQWKSTARIGKSAWIVVEGDESDGTFTRLPATVSVVTNMDEEHMDHYNTLDALEDAFHLFASNIPFYGFSVLCIDHPRVQRLVAKMECRHVVTCGLSPHADVRAYDVRPCGMSMLFSVDFSQQSFPMRDRIKDIRLPLVGEHNVKNALVAVALAATLGVENETIIDGLKHAPKVRRRFSHIGTSKKGAMIIDDYAHHPSEIRAVLQAAAGVTSPPSHTSHTWQGAWRGGGRRIVVFQPHRYSRLQSLFPEFCYALSQAEIVGIVPVYGAGEDAIEGIHRDKLIEGLRTYGHRHVYGLEGEHSLAPFIEEQAQSGDIVLCLGAGSISAWTHRLKDKEGFLS